MLIVSSQGADRFDAYQRAYPNAYVGSFRVGSGRAKGVAPIDAVSHTDGLAVCVGDLGDALPGGVLVVQDDANPPEAQNFKIVPLAWVLRAMTAGDQHADAMPDEPRRGLPTAQVRENHPDQEDPAP
ncbi:MAG: hypothetical protein KatS3mg103_0632 [Phycisphaerales bacterium]|nr:MAG: hypothetical protein KatS3mg103_0632 [Phycisphaerales bacterium]